MAFVTPSALVRPALARPSLSATSVFGSRLASSSRPVTARVNMGVVLPMFTTAMQKYKDDFPAFASRGWGATVKAERWNGRHAMFGLLVLVLTGYCKGHGLLPEGDLDVSMLGVLGSLGDMQSISMERATILVAHVHVLMVSVVAAMAPFSFQEKLLLEPGEDDDEPAGLFPEFAPGLNKSSELWNSRVAMLGVICIVGQAVATHTSVLDVLNLWLGNKLF